MSGRYLTVKPVTSLCVPRVFLWTALCIVTSHSVVFSVEVPKERRVDFGAIVSCNMLDVRCLRQPSSSFTLRRLSDACFRQWKKNWVYFNLLATYKTINTTYLNFLIQILLPLKSERGASSDLCNVTWIHLHWSPAGAINSKMMPETIIQSYFKLLYFVSQYISVACCLPLMLKVHSTQCKCFGDLLWVIWGYNDIEL